MNIRVLLILAACACAFVAVVLGFDLGWLGIDATDDYPGWHATALLLYLASLLTPGGK